MLKETELSTVFGANVGEAALEGGKIGATLGATTAVVNAFTVMESEVLVVDSVLTLSKSLAITPVVGARALAIGLLAGAAIGAGIYALCELI